MKYEYRHSGIDWIGDVPKHWKICRLKNIVELGNEKTDEKSKIEDYLEKDTGRVISFRNTTEVASKLMLFKRGDVLSGKLRLYLNKHYLALEEKEVNAILNQIKMQG